jgi:hypothetical protein
MDFASDERELRGCVLSMLETHIVMSSLIFRLVLILMFRLAFTLVFLLALSHVLCLVLLRVLRISSPQNHSDGFHWFGLKTSGDGFLQFDLKTGGDSFSRFDLKTGGVFLD